MKIKIILTSILTGVSVFMTTQSSLATEKSIYQICYCKKVVGETATTQLIGMNLTRQKNSQLSSKSVVIDQFINDNLGDFCRDAGQTMIVKGICP